MKTLYGVYLFITVCAMVLAYKLGAGEQGIAQEAARCMTHERIAEQDQCLKTLEADVGELYRAVKALSEQKREAAPTP
ncbi:hypothetical protein G7007_08505 [Pseudomonas entomophila]|uniref:hypothetical protein n=1 Tax=Pseudomonas entomophila TaxID=312306 RepID=UPI0015E3659B|nr:hypothetical protein [Pseudomonas entomophila]MBA1192901.1 hypothetical protein [Pseudomonas entomophila]